MELITRTVSNINESYDFVSTCKPFKIRKAVLSEGGLNERTAYVIGLRGTNGSFDKNDPLGIPVCLKSGCSMKNIYFELVKRSIFDNIPEGADIVFIGHSLGGMICQQLGSDNEIKSTYKVLSVMTMGSPYIIARGGKCPLNRIAEKTDFIPAICSAALLANSFIGDVHHESAGYFGKPVGAHTDSYQFGEVWKKYDCFGFKNGNHILTFIDDSGEDSPVLNSGI